MKEVTGTFRGYLAIPPGETIAEGLEDRGISQKEFAARMDMSNIQLTKLINGELQLTGKIAERLEMILHISADFWINSESIYRDDLQELNRKIN